MKKSVAFAAFLLMAGCMTASGLTPRQEANQWALAHATPVGEPENCIQISRLRNSVGRDDRTIDFNLIDGRVMRNRLPQACPGLAFEDRFLYRTSLDRLCSVDTITILHSGGGRGATCGLGSFQEVEIAERP